MTYEEKVDYLSSYRRLIQECNELQDEIIRLGHKKERMGTSFPKMPESASMDKKSALEELTIAIDELETRLRTRSSVYGRVLDSIEEAINQVKNPKEQQLLRLRYIYGYTFQKIADKMYYTDKQYASKVHKRILNKYDFN
mgnify:CR=1 FL=1